MVDAFGYLSVAQAFGHEVQDLSLTRGEDVEVCCLPSPCFFGREVLEQLPGRYDLALRCRLKARTSWSGYHPGVDVAAGSSFECSPGRWQVGAVTEDQYGSVGVQFPDTLYAFRKPLYSGCAEHDRGGDAFLRFTLFVVVSGFLFENQFQVNGGNRLLVTEPGGIGPGRRGSWMRARSVHLEVIIGQFVVEL